MKGFTLSFPISLVPDMGCGPSKIDDLPLVIHCRERKDFIKAASDHRLALAAAHVAYFHSLRHVGDAIRRFVDEELVLASSSTGSPVLTLPSDEFKSSLKKKKKKNDGAGDSHIQLPSSSSTSISHSPEDSRDKHAKHVKEVSDDEDSHLQLSSGSVSPISSAHAHFDHVNTPRRESQAQPYGYGYGYNYPHPPPPPQDNWSYPNANPIPSYPPQGFWGYPYPPPDTNPTPYMYYMKKSAAPSQTFVYRPPLESSGYSQYPDEWFPTSSPLYGRERRSPAPGPPPTPPRVSTWDYFNVFDSYDGGGGSNSQIRYEYGSTTSSPDSKELREREGIPDLEDETDPEISRTIYEDKKMKMKTNKADDGMGNVNRSRNYWEGTSRSVPMQKNSAQGSTSTSNYKTPQSFASEGVESGHIDIGNTTSSNGGGTSSTSSGGSIEAKSPDGVNLLKKEVSFEVEEVANMDVESSKPSSLTTLSAHGTRDLDEVVKEIRDEFVTASSFGKEVAVLLEVGQLPYQQRETGLRVLFSRILYLVAPNICSHPLPRSPVRVSARTMKMAKEYVELGQNIDENMENLSSILDKLYVWEKKLYKEVKDEERLRVLYEKKCKRLRTLDSQGAESSKIDATQASIKKLLTKIDVSIRAVDAISRRIHKLRDEELQPRLTELIYGLIRMWKSILRCHQKQFQAIMESKVRSLKANTGFQRESGLKATLELEVELSEWSAHFSDWINYQKAYVSSLNKWLMRCIKQELEVTSDGVPPFSPGRIGAPPIFVVCNDWSQAMDRDFVQAIYQQLRMEPYAVHTTFQYAGTDGKRHRLREARLFYDPPEYYDAPGGFLSFKPSIPKNLLLDGEHNVESHFSLVNFQIKQIRMALAIASMLNRILVMPPIWCRLDRLWFPHPGVLPGSMTRQPFICPLDHVFEVNVMLKELPVEEFGPAINFREYSFLDNPSIPKQLHESWLDVQLCQAGTNDCNASSNLSRPGLLRFPKRSSEETFEAVFSSFKDVKVIQFSSMQDAFPGFSDKKREEKLRKRMKRYVGIWCCVDGHNPGHIYYDMYWDETPNWKPLPPQTREDDHPHW